MRTRRNLNYYSTAIKSQNRQRNTKRRRTKRRRTKRRSTKRRRTKRRSTKRRSSKSRRNKKVGGGLFDRSQAYCDITAIKEEQPKLTDSSECKKWAYIGEKETDVFLWRDKGTTCGKEGKHGGKIKCLSNSIAEEEAAKAAAAASAAKAAASAAKAAAAAATAAAKKAAAAAAAAAAYAAYWGPKLSAAAEAAAEAQATKEAADKDKIDELTKDFPDDNIPERLELMKRYVQAEKDVHSLSGSQAQMIAPDKLKKLFDSIRTLKESNNELYDKLFDIANA